MFKKQKLNHVNMKLFKLKYWFILIKRKLGRVWGCFSFVREAKVSAN